MHVVSSDDTNYDVGERDNVSSIRFVNQSDEHYMKINNALILRPGQNFEFRCEVGIFESSFNFYFYLPSSITNNNYEYELINSLKIEAVIILTKL